MGYIVKFLIQLDMNNKRNFITSIFFTGLLVLICSSCKKLIEIPQPTDSITTTKVFATDAQANSAMAGVYTQIIHDQTNTVSAYSGFGTGLTMLLGSMCANDLIATSVGTQGTSNYNLNRINRNDSYPYAIWSTAYHTVYGADAVIEGIEASTSTMLHDRFRKSLTAEAKFLRAFAYFYLVNLFGDVPLVMTTDFNKTVNMTRTPKQEVYNQIIKDLTEAKAALPVDFSDFGQERIRASKWAATALLARVYLYTGDYVNAELQSSEVISHSELFQLTPELNDVFLANSKEAIWQLQQNSDGSQGTATPEAYTILPGKNPEGLPSVPYVLSRELTDAFEPSDKRKTNWCWSGIRNGQLTYFPYKYKIGSYNREMSVPPTEYYMVLRLAEQYLIRAEARTLGNGQLDMAVADLNQIRHRAGLDNLPVTLSRNEVIRKIEQEREVEFFAEWGHRWLDLKRTGRAHDVLSAVPMKQPWTGDYQLLYPIPPTEITANSKLTQNPGY
jgi:hypothetical protein